MTEQVKEELLSIKSSSADKMLHAKDVVDWARHHPQSALHDHFEWDDDKAAEEYRLWQARCIIQVHVVNEDGTPQLVSLTIDRAKGGGYRAIGDVVANEMLAKVLLADALAELQRVQIKHERVKELVPVWAAVARVRKQHERDNPPSPAKAQPAKGQRRKPAPAREMRP